MDLKERIELARTTMNALEQIEANKGKVPDGFILEFRADWSKDWIESCHTITTDIATVDNSGFYRLRSATPRHVPLGPEDVPPGSAISFNSGMTWGLVSEVRGSCLIAAGCTYYWQRLMDDRARIKRPGEDWRLCSKDASN